MGLSLALPRSASLTDELLAPVPAIGAEELQVVRERVASALVPLAGELPAGERLVLDGHRFRTVLRRPQTMTANEEPFSPSPATCRRAVGLAAVERCLRRRASGPAQAVAQVLEDGAEDAVGADRDQGRAPWWGRWYAGLTPGARAVTAAEATTWATQLWTSFDWHRLPVPVVVGGHDDWWDVPGRRLTLRGRAEVRVRVDGRSVLVVVGGGVPDADSRSELLFTALVCALSGGVRSAPGRVVGLWPAAGQVRVVPVGARTLDSAVDATVSAAASWVDALIERRQALPV